MLLLSITIVPLETAAGLDDQQLQPSLCVKWISNVERVPMSAIRSYYSYSRLGLGVVNKTGPTLGNNANSICYDLVGINANETVMYYFEQLEHGGGDAKCANISFHRVIGAEYRLVSY